MQTLNRVFRDLEDHAGDYADADRAWQAGRRRRAHRRGGLIAVLIAVVVLSGVVGVVRLTGGGQVAQPAGPVITVAPTDTAPSLPADAVDAGFLVYTACPYGCPTFLITKDGRRYLLGQQTAAPPGNFTLSPDGTWIGQPDEQGYVLRRLVGTEVLRVPLPAGVEPGTRISPWAWSSDGRTLVLGAHRDGNVAHWFSVALPEAVVSDAPVPKGYEPVGITGAGQLLLMADDTYAKSSGQLTLVVGDSKQNLTLVAPGSAVFANADHGPSIKLSGDRVLALVYSGETTQVAAYSQSGELLEQIELSATEAAVGAEHGEPVVLDVPLSGGPTATLWRVSSGQRVRLAELPVQSLVALPGGTR